MRGKKLLAMTLCTVMTAGLLAGCGGGKGNTSAAVDLSSAELTGEENEWGWIVPEETLVLDVYGGEGDQEKLVKDEYGGKAKLDGWLKDNLNVQINWQYYSTAMDEKLNLVMTLKASIDRARYIIDNANLYCFLVTDCGWKPDYIWEILNSNVKNEIAERVINKWNQGYAG